MNIDESIFEWNDEYNIGVEEIDNAHKQLFKIVSRIACNFKDSNFEKNKAMCMEAVKYLKSYSIKHFGEEEAYQLEIGYKGFDSHKKMHDNMRNVVIPALEKEMESKSYSKESIEHFLGVCVGWLTAHILIEDRAITGNVTSKFGATADDRSIDKLADIIREYSFDLFMMNAELFSKTYTGHKLKKLFCYRDVLERADGEKYAIVTAIEYPMLEMIARKFIRQEMLELDAVMLPLLSEMLNSFNTEVSIALFDSTPTFKESSAISEEDFYALYDKVYPEYSLLWRTYCGHFVTAVCRVSQP